MSFKSNFLATPQFCRFRKEKLPEVAVGVVQPHRLGAPLCLNAKRVQKSGIGGIPHQESAYSGVLEQLVAAGMRTAPVIPTG